MKLTLTDILIGIAISIGRLVQFAGVMLRGMWDTLGEKP